MHKLCDAHHRITLCGRSCCICMYVRLHTCTLPHIQPEENGNDIICMKYVKKQFTYCQHSPCCVCGLSKYNCNCSRNKFAVNTISLLFARTITQYMLRICVPVGNSHHFMINSTNFPSSSGFAYSKYAHTNNMFSLTLRMFNNRNCDTLRACVSNHCCRVDYVPRTQTPPKTAHTCARAPLPN